MKTRIYFFLMSLLCLLIIGCDDIIEQDITDKTVELRSPANGLQASQNLHQFSWAELDGATNYRLQIVSPSFDSIVHLIVDTDLETTIQEITLNPGVYQWMVIGENFGYETANNQIFDLTITGDSSLNLANRSVILLNPASNFITNETSVDFSWEGLSNADSYTFQIASPDFSQPSFIITNEIIEGTTFSGVFTTGDYQWRVRGENENSTGLWTERSFQIDTAIPNAPQLQSPDDGELVSLPFLLEWTSDVNSFMDSLYVYQDSLVTAPVLAISTSDTEYLFNNTASMQYFWRVRTIDAAGNKSGYSELRKFFIP